MARKPVAEKTGVKRQGLIADRDALSKAIDRARASTAAKTTMPVLECVLLVSNGPRLDVTGTDLYVATRATISVETNGENVAVCASAKDLHGAVKAMPSGFVRLRAEENHLVVEAAEGKRSFKIRTLPADDYPKIAESSGVTGFSIPTEALLAAVTATLSGVSHDQTSPGKNSMLFDPQEDGCVLVSTDGHRLHTRALDARGVEKMAIPRSAVEQIRGVCEGEESIEISRQGGAVFFVTTAATFWAKLVDEASFPPWRQVMLARAKFDESRASVKSLAEAVKAISMMSSAKTGGVYFDFLADRIVLTSSNDEGRGEASDEVPAEKSGKTARIHLNAGYVLDALAGVGTEHVRIGVAGDLDPISFCDDEGDEFRAVVMPMR